MKAVIFSDSHGSLGRMKAIIKKVADFDMFIHLGDHIGDVERVDVSSFKTVVSVSGNCDRNGSVPFSLFEFGGFRVFAVHGHRYGIKHSPRDLFYAAKEKGADICLFGHTHIAEVFNEEGVLFVNPGSISSPRGGLPSYAVLNVDGDDAEATVIADYGNGIYKPFLNTKYKNL